MPASRCAASILLLLAAAAHAGDDGAFDGPFLPAAPAWSLAVGDLNADGHPDLCLGQVDSQLAVRLGLGGSAFAEPWLLPIAALNLRQVELVDVDADGLLDALVRTDDDDLSPSVLRLFLGAGDGTLTAQATWLAPVVTSSMRVTDLQPDGAPDVLLTSQYAGTTRVLLGDGHGAFVQVAEFGSTSLNADAADVTGEGSPDIVAAGSDHSVVILRGDGTGQFAAPITVPVGLNALLVSVGDLNGDGLADLLAGHFNVLHVLLAKGHAAFSSSQWLNGISADVCLADLDEDGDLDAVGRWYDFAQVGLNDGSGLLTFEQRYAAGQYAEKLRVADATGDGDLDLLFAPSLLVEPFGPQLTLLSGRGDGTFTGNVLPMDSFPSSLTTGDLDEDGTADIACLEATYSVLHTLAGTGQGNFVEAAEVPTPFPGGIPQTGDLDGDGHLDVVIDANDVVLHRGAGDGALLPKETDTKSELVLLRQADLDADGDTDLVAWQQNTSQLRSLLNDGTAHFTEQVDFTQFGAVQGLCLADLGGDGWPDASLALGYTGVLQDGLHVRQGLGDGTFGAPVVVAVEDGLFDLEAADIDSDGDLDLASLADLDNGLLWFRNDGLGTLQVAGPGIPTATDIAMDLLLADVTRDGVVDAVVLHWVTFNDPYEAVLTLAGLGDGLFAPLDQTLINPGYGLEPRDADADGALDLLSGNQQITLLLNRNGPWDDLGHALAGTHGLPRQVGSGTAQPGAVVVVALHDAVRNSLAMQVIGFGVGNLPFKGGVLVPTPDLVNSPLLTDAEGELLLGGTWPAAFTAGDALVMQTWIRDDAAPALWSASNALRATTP